MSDYYKSSGAPWNFGCYKSLKSFHSVFVYFLSMDIFEIPQGTPFFLQFFFQIYQQNLLHRFDQLNCTACEMRVLFISLISYVIMKCYYVMYYDVIMKSYYNVIYLITLNYFSLSHYQLSLSGLQCWNCLYWRALYICIMPSTEAIVLLVRHDSGANNNNSWLAKTVQSCQHILFNSC